MPKPLAPSRVRFGVFEIDLESGELRKQGIKIKLHDQPFRVLAMLVERPGEVITREEFREKLWPADTYVDWDLGLNSSVMRLRAALGDSAENPRFVETLPRRGYRLIVPVETIGLAQNVSPPTPPAVSVSDTPIAAPSSPPSVSPEEAELSDAKPTGGWPEVPHRRK
jgi:DNA-binding winged helix-turn-helix (wHTH) protein